MTSARFAFLLWCALVAFSRALLFTFMKYKYTALNRLSWFCTATIPNPASLLFPFETEPSQLEPPNLKVKIGIS